MLVRVCKINAIYNFVHFPILRIYKKNLMSFSISYTSKRNDYYHNLTLNNKIL